MLGGEQLLRFSGFTGQLCYPNTFTMLPTIIFGKKILLKLTKSPARNTRAILEHRGARATSNAELNMSIIIISTSFFNSWTTDSPNQIKVLNMSKTTQAFTSFTEM